MNKLTSVHAVILLIIGINCHTVFSQQINTPEYDPQTNNWYRVSNQNASGSSSNTWQFVQTPVSAQITDIFFTDSLNGWASHTGMGVIKTTDSGFNWTAASFNDTNFTTGFNGVYFINNNTGWSVGGALQIRKTTNGGSSWFRQIPPPVAGIAHSVYFMDANTGFVAGSKSFPYIPFICKTTNGGNNWLEISPVISGAQELRDQYWFNSTTGYICGYDVLLYTTNGGTNFVNRYANIPPSGNGHISLLAINFVNDQTGWIGAANLERHNVYKTTNGGLNWFFQDNPVSQGGMNQINDVLFINIDTGWAVHGTPSTGAVMFTTNGGDNWTIEEQSVNWFDCLSIYQNKKIWCGASGGRVWYSIRESTVGISGNNNENPQVFRLYQNYPNPFNPVTKIRFSLPAGDGFNGHLRLIIYDNLGREISTLVNSNYSPGTYETGFDGTNFPGGVYYYKIIAGNYTEARKMILLK